MNRSRVLATICLILVTIPGLWKQVPVLSQGEQTTTFANQLIFLAIAPPSDNPGILDLYEFSGSNAVLSSVVLPGIPLSAAWSPDGSTVFFIMITGQSGSEAPLSNFDIYHLDTQRKAFSKLTDTPDCPEIGLIWPASSQFLFYSSFCRDSQATVFWQLDSSTGVSEKLGEVQWDGTWAVWSPDASWVALLAPRKGEDGSAYNQLMLVSPDGQSKVDLMNDVHPGYQLQQSTVLAWSPLGDWLAYSTKTQNLDQGVVNQIIAVRSDGGERRVLHTSQSGQECLNPVWSPDGLLLAFTCGENLFTVQIDGTGLKNLTSPSGGKAVEYPAWAPDGSQLALISLSSDGIRRLESVQASGENRQVIAQTLAIQTFALVWNPIAHPVEQPISLNSNSPEPTSQISGSPTAIPADLVANPTILSQGTVPASNSPSNDQVGLSLNLSSIWLLGLFFVIGGVGVFYLLRRAGRMPDLVEREKERRIRRNTRKKERLVQSPVKKVAPARVVKPSASHISQPEEDSPDQHIGYGQYSEPAGLLEQGVQQIRSKDIEGGIVTLRHYLEIFPDDPNAWLWLGWATGLIKEFRTAERCFLRASHLGSAQAAEALDWLSKQR